MRADASGDDDLTAGILIERAYYGAMSTGGESVPPTSVDDELLADPTFDEVAGELELDSLVGVAPAQTPTVTEVFAGVESSIGRRGGTQLLGLHLAFLGVAEAISTFSGQEQLAGHDTFDNTKKRGGGERAVDTLTILIPDEAGKDHQFGIRRYVNKVIETFKGPRLRRTGYPSSPMQHTKRWADWTANLDAILDMTRAERTALAELLYGSVLDLDKDIPRAVLRTVQDPFVKVIGGFPRQRQTGENSGAALQGIAYGYVCADAPELTPRSAGVRTGAKRAGLVGDVDGYNGPFLELAVEVKDKDLDDFGELVDFLSNLASHPKTTAVVICAGVTEEVKEKCEEHAIRVLTLGEMTELVQRWTASKQTRAVRETLAYYAIIESSPALANRFQSFLEAEDIDYRVN
jgi:hypothetical protein